MRILIVEDEYNLADVVKSALKKENYEVDISTSGDEGLDNALTNIYDLIILDVMLPKVNGFDILKEIRNNNINTKVIMLTAKAELEDKLSGFNLGADDYLTKPFHIEELVARVNIKLRKQNKFKSLDYIEIGDLRLNIKKSILSCLSTSDEVEVSKKEFMLLEYFIKNPDTIISKEQLYDNVWGLESEIWSNNLEAYLSFIRKKLKIIGSSVNIKAVRGFGYKLEVEDEKIKN